MHRERLFCGKEIQAISSTTGSDKLVITFGFAMANKKEEDFFFGVSFLEKKRIDYIAIDSFDNLWWQSSEIFACIEEIYKRGILKMYREIICYGSSMGGYGALLFSHILRATSVVALSPQYTIDNSKIKYDLRFSNYAKQINFFLDDLPQYYSKTARKLVFFDPHDIDGQHAARMQGIPNVELVKMPFAGHSVTAFMQEVGILSKVIESVIGGTFSKADFRNQIRSTRRNSARYFSCLAEGLYKRNTKYTDLPIRLAIKSFSLSQNAKIARFIALRFAEVGNYEQSKEWFSKAIEIKTDLILSLRSIISLSIKHGRHEDALHFFKIGIKGKECGLISASGLASLEETIGKSIENEQ